jgi:hypothetical protein
MLPTIDLYDEATLKTQEIGNIGTKRMLSPEFVISQTTITQVMPQELFGIGLIFP